MAKHTPQLFLVVSVIQKTKFRLTYLFSLQISPLFMSKLRMIEDLLTWFFHHLAAISNAFFPKMRNRKRRELRKRFHLEDFSCCIFSHASMKNWQIAYHAVFPAPLAVTTKGFSILKFMNSIIAVDPLPSHTRIFWFECGVHPALSNQYLIHLNKEVGSSRS